MAAGTRYLLGCFVAILLLAVAAASALLWQAESVGREQAIQRLQSAVPVALDLQAVGLRELSLRSQALAGDRAFVDYVAQSLVPADGGNIDRASISDLLSERRDGYDLAMVLDASGTPVAQVGLLIKPDASIRNEPLVTQAIASLKPVAGAWVQDGKLLWVVASPLLHDAVVQGVLLTATPAGSRYVADLNRYTGLQAVVLAAADQGYVIAASRGLPEWLIQQTTADAARMSVPADLPAQGMPSLLAVNDQSQQAWLIPLATMRGRATTLIITPKLAGKSAIAFSLGIVALAAVLSWLAVWVSWRRTRRPLLQLADLLDHAATGDVDALADGGGSRLVQRVRESINALLKRERSGGRH